MAIMLALTAIPAYLISQVHSYTMLLGLAFLFCRNLLASRPGRAIRGLSHLREHPNDIVILPVVVVMVMVIALPLKVISILTMRRSGWMTRHSDTTGGEGQDNASLHHQGLLSPPEAGAGA